MYGGLFGDLPSAKKQKSSSSNNVATPPETSTTKKDDDKNTITKNESNETTTKKNAAKGRNQFLQMVGKSGTAMAFVPTAALKPKKSSVEPPSSSSNAASTKANNKTTAAAAAAKAGPKSQFEAFTTTTTTRIVAADKGKEDAVVVNIHGTGEDGVGNDAQSGNTNNDATTSTSAAPSIPSESLFHDDDEPKETITDPYDPYVPNDLLEYWDTLAAKKHREKLEQDAKEALERQKSIRKSLEESNNARTAQPTGRGRGNVSNLPAWMTEKGKQQQEGLGAAASAPPPPPSLGRGRGRGVSNLPAWLVEKQRKEGVTGQE